MTEPIPFKPVDESIERRQLAEESKGLLESKALCAAILGLRKQWFAEWVASTNDEQDKRLKAQIRALEAIPQELQILINDQTMAQARKK